MISLNRPYAGSPAGTILELPASTEAALIAQGLATTSAAVPTAGAVTVNAMRGSSAVAAGVASVVVTNSFVDVTSTVLATISQAAADGTAFGVARVTPAAGSFTIALLANTTAITQVDWVVFNNQVPTTTN